MHFSLLQPSPSSLSAWIISLELRNVGYKLFNPAYSFIESGNTYCVLCVQGPLEALGRYHESKQIKASDLELSFCLGENELVKYIMANI